MDGDGTESIWVCVEITYKFVFAKENFLSRRSSVVKTNHMRHVSSSQSL